MLELRWTIEAPASPIRRLALLFVGMFALAGVVLGITMHDSLGLAGAGLLALGIALMIVGANVSTTLAETRHDRRHPHRFVRVRIDPQQLHIEDGHFADGDAVVTHRLVSIDTATIRGVRYDYDPSSGHELVFDLGDRERRVYNSLLEEPEHLASEINRCLARMRASPDRG